MLWLMENCDVLRDPRNQSWRVLFTAEFLFLLLSICFLMLAILLDLKYYANRSNNQNKAIFPLTVPFVMLANKPNAIIGLI